MLNFAPYLKTINTMNEEKQPTALVTTESNPASLLAMAVSKDLDISKIEKLLELQERYNATQARKSFLAAISKFQSMVPALEKNKQIAFGNTKYKFAPLGEIEKQIKDIMFECGLSKRWELEYPEGKILCTCIVSHQDGHSEKTAMSGTKDTSGNKNEMQQNASAITYLQRYTLICALGLTTADEDTDGHDDKSQNSGAGQQQQQAPDKPWLNEGTKEWAAAVTLVNEGHANEAVLERVKTKYRVNKTQEAAILAMKPQSTESTQAEQPEQKGEQRKEEPKKEAPKQEEKPAAAGKPKKQLTADIKRQWEELNEADSKFAKGEVPDLVREYNNNITKLAKKQVSLDTILGVYDLDDDVRDHYEIILQS